MKPKGANENDEGLLEYLEDIKYPTDSVQYRREAASLPCPFRNLVLVTTRQELRSPVLADMFGAPYLAVVKGDNDIAFKKLGGGAVAFLTCIDHPADVQLVRSKQSAYSAGIAH